MKFEKLTVKDLVNAGVFSVLVLACVWCAGMVGYLPVLMPFVPFFCCLVGGPVFLLYTTRINKFGMMLIMGVLFAIVFSSSGHGIFIVPGVLIVSFLGELLLAKGHYASVRYSRWAFTVFSLFSSAALLPLFISRAAYLQTLIDQGYGAEYARQLDAIMPLWTFAPIVVLGAVGAYAGSTLGIKILNKHFKKAGMV